MVRNRALLYVSEPAKGIVPTENFKLSDGDIDFDSVPLNGGVLLKTLYLASDPYIRYRMREPHIPAFCPPIQLGDPVDNSGVGLVLRSEDPEFQPGDFVAGYLEFAEYSVYPGRIVHDYKVPLSKVEKLPNAPLSIYIGTLGMPGTTAYQGIKYFASEKLKTAKTMFVSGGAGAVGTFVIEYVKVLAPHVKIIASAGSAQKVQILKDAGADVAFDYKHEDTRKVLETNGPIDIYWDNVAGPTLDAALDNFRDEGLIIACGAISQASHDDSSVVRHFDEIFKRSLTVRGFTVYHGESAVVVPKFYEEVVPLVVQGKITSREHQPRAPLQWSRRGWQSPCRRTCRRECWQARHRRRRGMISEIHGLPVYPTFTTVNKQSVLLYRPGSSCINPVDLLPYEHRLHVRGNCVAQQSDFAHSAPYSTHCQYNGTSTFHSRCSSLRGFSLCFPGSCGRTCGT